MHVPLSQLNECLLLKCWDNPDTTTALHYHQLLFRHELECLGNTIEGVEEGLRDTVEDGLGFKTQDARWSPGQLDN